MNNENTKCACRLNQNKLTARAPEEIKPLENRINRIIGQLNGVKSMIAENRYCADVLIQLSAISNAVKALSSIVMKDHLTGCVTQKVKQGDEQIMQEVVDLFKRFS